MAPFGPLGGQGARLGMLRDGDVLLGARLGMLRHGDFLGAFPG